MRALVLFLGLFACAGAPAQVYKWTDEKGVVHYGDKPNSPNAKPVTLPELMPFGSGSRKSTPRNFKGPAPYGGSGPKVEITYPAPDATLNTSGQFDVRVAISPVLGDTQKLNYFLDGELQNPVPTASRSFVYAGVEKGDHMLSVAVVDADGREISRSEPVIVHLQAPVAAKP
jgi:hypothetical protein